MNQVITDEDRVRLAKKEYDPLQLKKEVIISVSDEKEKTIGIVSQKINNKPTGEQTYIITDKYTPPTASISERNKVKELTILYKGSTAPANGNFNVPKHPDYRDVREDWLDNDIPTAIQITHGGGSHCNTPTKILRRNLKTNNETLPKRPNLRIRSFSRLHERPVRYRRLR